MKKKFDCVAMKHKAALKIRKEIEKFGEGRELEYWQERHKKLAALKEKLNSKVHK